MLLTQVECGGCVEVYPDYCEACKEANQRIALDTEIKPTDGVGSIRLSGDSYIVENDSITPVAIARICTANKDERQEAADAVMVAFAWEMWERTLQAAKTDRDDYEAAGIVARADKMYRELMEKVENYG